MKLLNSCEISTVSGGDLNVGVMLPVDPNAEINFTSGFNAAVNLVGGIAGFTIGIPCAIVVLPAKGVYSIGESAYYTIQDWIA